MEVSCFLYASVTNAIQNGSHNLKPTLTNMIYWSVTEHSQLSQFQTSRKVPYAAEDNMHRIHS